MLSLDGAKTEEDAREEKGEEARCHLRPLSPASLCPCQLRPSLINHSTSCLSPKNLSEAAKCSSFSLAVFSDVVGDCTFSRSRIHILHRPKAY
jgi:hypothetical protein